MINLLPQEEKKILRREYFVRVVAAVFFAIAFIGVCAGAFLVPSFILANIKYKNQQEAENQYLSLFGDANSALIGEVKETNAQLSIFPNNPGSFIATEDILFPLFTSRSGGVRLNNIFYAVKVHASSLPI